MDMNSAIASINFLAIIVCGIVAFLIGGIWYSVLFERAWTQFNHFDKEDLKKGNTALIFVGSFFLAILIALNMSLFLGPERTLGFGAFAGFMAGLFWVAAAFGITYLFERKPFGLFFINAGYHVVLFTVVGIILGAWK